MKRRYKIIILGVCAYFGIFIGPIAASNVYCDYFTQEQCTSIISGVNLVPFNFIFSSVSDDNCNSYGSYDMRSFCNIQRGHFTWPFPPNRSHELEDNCDTICHQNSILEAKLDLEQEELEIRESIKYEDDPQKIKQLENEAERLDILQKIMDLHYEIEIAKGNWDYFKAQKLTDKMNNLEDKYIELVEIHEN